MKKYHQSERRCGEFRWTRLEKHDRRWIGSI